MIFEARVLTRSNAIHLLRVEATDRADALRQLHAQGLQTLSVRSVWVAGARSGWRRRRFSLLLFSQELHALLLAGLTLIEALEGLIEKETAPDARGVLQRLIAMIREGQRFSAVLSAMPETFPPLYFGLMQAAETTGALPAALARYVEYQQRVDVVRSKIVSASIYPAILMVVGGLVTTFLGGYVIPRFASIYKDSGRELPLMSAWLLGGGQFLAEHALSAAVVTIILLIIAAAYARHLHRSGALSRSLLRLPAVGPRLHLYEISRVYMTLGMLLESGIPVVAALRMSEGVVSRHVRESLARARQTIESGAAFADTFNDHALTTSISFRMLRVGERTGKLGAMLVQASNFYDNDISRFIDRFTRAFEPIMMLLIGVVVGGIVVLLYLPIFDLATSLQ
ncbi:type II secretion system F family protein [Cupriavidus pauculus]|uniref:type II secretion system F family protein n=1 Tax=Cupriavidus pauculus TaxID=82633 RepID=UPI001EE2247F|nr:type II secretion system F family protein [Cupriavidus pauculus]GJG96674.1 type II secretion system F family protein [Cupriavidus pauculus]